MPRKPTAVNWSEAERLAKRKPDTEIRLPKARVVGLPQKYERSYRSLPKGAKVVYRSPGPGQHFQVREYDDHWTVDFDRYHPKHNPVQHALKDSPQETALAVLAGAALAGGFFG